MITKDLIELDLDRLRRLGLGSVEILNQTDVQITYKLTLKDSHNPSKVIEATGKVQQLFGPRLLSSGSFVDEEHGNNCVTARVCLQFSKLTVNAPAMASVKSFLMRASWFDSLTPEQQQGYLEEHPNSKYAQNKKQTPKSDEKPAQAPATDSSSPPAPVISKKAASFLHRALSGSKDAIATNLNERLADIKGSASALKTLFSGKPLTDEHKGSLKAVAQKTVDIAISHVPGGPAAQLLAKVGVKLVYVAFYRLRNRHDAAANHGKAIVDELLNTALDAAKDTVTPLKPKTHLHSKSRKASK